MTLRRGVLAVAGLAAASVAGLSAYILTPPPAGPGPFDAVVVHAGGRGERLSTALEMMEAGLASTLVIMGGTVEGWEEANHRCWSDAGYEVLCPTPIPASTAGEARTLAALATERDWERIAAVTSDYHLRRTLMLDRSCISAEVVGVPAPSRLTVLGLLPKLAHEIVGLAYSWLVQRC